MNFLAYRIAGVEEETLIQMQGLKKRTIYDYRKEIRKLLDLPCTKAVDELIEKFQGEHLKSGVNVG